MNRSLRLVKSISYRVLSILLQVIIVGKIIGFQWTWFILALNGVLILAYYLHEIAWERIVALLDNTGIRYNYPRVPLPQKVKAIVANARPYTLILPLFGGYFMIQASLGRFEVPTPDPLKTISAILSMVLINATGNYWNSIVDVDIDRVNKPYRPLPRGLLSVREATLISVVGALLSIVFAALVGLPFLLFAGATLIVTGLYSIPPVRLKARFMLNNAAQAVIRGILGPVAMWSVYSTIGMPVLVLSGMMFVFIMGAQSIKDIPDIEGDRQFAIKTFPVVLGVQATQTIIVMATIGSLVMALVTFDTIGLFVPLLFLPVAAAFIYFTFRPRGTITENQLGWTFMYLCMVTQILGFTLGRII